jgi:hypothetical protein
MDKYHERFLLSALGANKDFFQRGEFDVMRRAFNLPLPESELERDGMRPKTLVGMSGILYNKKRQINLIKMLDIQELRTYQINVVGTVRNCVDDGSLRYQNRARGGVVGSFVGHDLLRRGANRTY